MAAFRIVIQVGNRPMTFGDGCVTVTVIVQCDLQLGIPLGSSGISVDLQAVSALTRPPKRTAVGQQTALNDRVRNKSSKYSKQINYVTN